MFLNFFVSLVEPTTTKIQVSLFGNDKTYDASDEKNPNTSLGGMAEQTKKIALFDKVLN